jgi:hypothetical protein
MREIIAKAARAAFHGRLLVLESSRGHHRPDFDDLTPLPLRRIHPKQRATTSRFVLYVTWRKEKRPLRPLLTPTSLSRRKEGHFLIILGTPKAVHQIARIPEYHSADSEQATRSHSHFYFLGPSSKSRARTDGTVYFKSY